MTNDQQSGNGPSNTITLAVSFLSHFFLLVPVIYIVALAFGKYSFFSWHPICISLGVGLFISEAVFGISGEAYLVSKLPRHKRVTLHWIFHSVGLGLLIIGFIIIVVNKVEHEKRHFATPHAILGLITILLVLLTAVFGIVTNNPRWFYPRVRPVLIKIVHAFGGIAVMILLLASLITGTYTRWWPGSDAGRSLTFTSFFVAGVLILIKPILGAVSRSKMIFGLPPSDT